MTVGKKFWKGVFWGVSISALMWIFIIYLIAKVSEVGVVL
jgi:hypothetical protein